MLNYTIINLFEELSKEQKEIIQKLNNKDLDIKEQKELNKKLDAIGLFLNSVIKFRRVYK